MIFPDLLTSTTKDIKYKICLINFKYVVKYIVKF